MLHCSETQNNQLFHIKHEMIVSDPQVSLFKVKTGVYSEEFEFI